MNKHEQHIIVNHLVSKLSPFFIILFGSTVKGTSNNSSDFDVAFLSDKQLDRYELFMISQELASKLNRDVDLIDLNQASTVFQTQVIHTGHVIYCSNERKKAEFDLKVLKMYAKLNEERLPILKRIEESGSIYEK
ncbi:nucleotidyltransferase domain-containing protein [Alkalihalobacillus sp. MEB130]|uniref:type VII toxin-antitoxin system MntA family adenylyltransferase antitoxin n=1 Tax=Alkalihalobacillus sp. MEB130 TaxID=2976704 RepID=UPI0028DD8812|nr:nucleotidyltransferase domain-containing protein [Alkalihalobacillus sp. MEB130]MDT8860227.1 nucleotidyltransferase domain-containing protein [Alkalihalobacillus sp. MEB130]